MKTDTTILNNLNEDKVKDLVEDLIAAFQKHKPNVAEIIVAYGNVAYTLGTSIEGYQDKGPSVEELEKLYYTNPTIGVALALQGAMITTWLDTPPTKS
jgi:uncharacterized protein YejL (UPF0352 family)